MGLCLLMTPICDAWFSRVTGLTPGDSAPAAGWIYMGITSTEEEAQVGPGSFVTGAFPDWAGFNRDEINEKYGRLILAEMQKFLHHERSYRFFIRKTMYQWLDPWFSSAAMTCCRADRPIEVPEMLQAFLSGKGMRWMQHMLTILLTGVYLLSAFDAASVIRRQKEDWKNMAAFLLQIYYIGGFVFQLFWESKARYCFPYFLCLLPLAASGAVTVFRKISFLEGKLHNKNGNESNIMSSDK